MSLTAKPSLHDNDALLTYRVGPVLCCGPTLTIVTITPPPAKLTHPPGTNTAEPGIFKHGADIVSATDLRYRFGVKQENWKHPGQVIIAKHADLTRGYFVDEIIDVTHFPETGWGQLPAYLPRGVFSRTLVIHKKIYLYAEFEKLSQLQGSGYLSDYIAHLEDQLEKESKTITHKPVSKNNSGKKETVTTPEISRPETEQPKSTRPKIDDTPAVDILTENIQPKIIQPEIIQPEIIQPKKIIVIDKQTSSTTIPENKLPLTTVLTSEKHDYKKNILQNKITNKAGHKKSENNINKPLQSQLATNQPDTKIEIKEAQQSTAKNIKTNPHNIANNTNDLTKNKTAPLTKNKASLTENTNVVNTYTQHNEIEHNSHSFSLLFILLVLILISGGGYYYFLTPERQDDAIKNTNKYSDNIGNTLTENPGQQEKYNNQKNNSTETTPATQIIDTPLQAVRPTSQTKVADNSNQQNNNKDTPKKDPTEYHASINQDNTTITIELNGPLPPRVINTHTELANKNESNAIENKTSNQQTSQDSDNKNISDISNDKKITTPQKNIVKDSTIEIIHIIVKGDTLWDIAKHYLQNPFLYPELAKLSRIRNPDLIYPGNRVRIIYHPKN